MRDGKIGVAIIGCGNIAGPYADDLKNNYAEIELLGVSDMDAARAQRFGQDHGVCVYADNAALLADPAVDVVVNLTSHFAHYDISKQALEAGKHVYSEKPLAVKTDEAFALVDLAKQKGLRLGCSPFTLMGEAQQTAWKAIRDGRLGTVRAIYAEVNWGRIESWHPAPGPFYEVGALFDVGVYPLTILTAMFGPARRVQAYGKVLYPDRVTREGVPFHISTPDWVVTVLEMGDAVARLTTSFYVPNNKAQTGIEFHGDLGSLHLRSWHSFDSQVDIATFDDSYQAMKLIRPPAPDVPWGRGVWEMAAAMLANRPHRFTGEQAAHIVEVLNAAAQSALTGQRVDVVSTFTPPAPMDWAR